MLRFFPYDEQVCFGDGGFREMLAECGGSSRQIRELPWFLDTYSGCFMYIAEGKIQPFYSY